MLMLMLMLMLILILILILILMLMLVSAVEAGVSPATSFVSDSRYAPEPDHYRFHGNASRSTFPPVRIMPTRFSATSIFPS